MRTYKYIDYQQNRKVIFECQAGSISAADLKFEQVQGTHPVKLNWIGCQIGETKDV